MQPTWTVELDDNSLVRYGEGTLFRDLPLDRVRRLIIEVAEHRHEVVIDPPMRPIYFTNHEIEVNPNTGEQNARAVVCVGWQRTVKGVNVKALSWIAADGRVIHTDRDYPGLEAVSVGQ